MKTAGGRGGGGTSLREANWNVPLNEFAFSRPGLTINWGLQNNIRAKVTKMSITGRKIDYNGVGALRGQRHIPSNEYIK